jgi:hypothetical protein
MFRRYTKCTLKDSSLYIKFISFWKSDVTLDEDKDEYDTIYLDGDIDTLCIYIG